MEKLGREKTPLGWHENRSVISQCLIVTSNYSTTLILIHVEFSTAFLYRIAWPCIETMIARSFICAQPNLQRPLLSHIAIAVFTT